VPSHPKSREDALTSLRRLAKEREVVRFRDLPWALGRAVLFHYGSLRAASRAAALAAEQAFQGA
jgi:hypothetical protein